VPLEDRILNALKLDDYLNIDYRRNGSNDRVNLYVAYYGSQRKGASAHSPRTCIPGGGWKIDRIRQVNLDVVGPNGQPLAVNRLVISKGARRELVYYWFQQRGRIVTNEFLVKWYILIDSMLRHRTDGALVRLVTSLGAGEPESAADQRLASFAALAYPELATMIPE
jgi:EpsI family protein